MEISRRSEERGPMSVIAACADIVRTPDPLLLTFSSCPDNAILFRIHARSGVAHYSSTGIEQNTLELYVLCEVIAIFH